MSTHHPGLGPAEVVAVRNALQQRAARFEWVDWNATRLAWRVWSREWEAELLEQSRANRDLGARRLLEARRQLEHYRAYKEERRRDGRAPSAEQSAAPSAEPGSEERA